MCPFYEVVDLEVLDSLSAYPTAVFDFLAVFGILVVLAVAAEVVANEVGFAEGRSLLPKGCCLEEAHRRSDVVDSTYLGSTWFLCRLLVTCCLWRVR